MNELKGSKGGAFLIALLLLAAACPAARPAAAQERQARDAEGVQDSTARFGSGRSPALERQFRRALTAWRTRASLPEAKARLDHVLRARPSDAQAHKLRARVLLKMNRPEDALRDAKRAAALQPQDGEAHLLHAEAARKSSRLQEAGRALDRAAAHLPEDAALHTRLSWNAMLLDRPAQAEAFARVALALDSTSAPAYRQLARVFLQRGRADEAVSVLARGLRAGVVPPRTVREDDLLRPLVDRPRLKRLLNP